MPNPAGIVLPAGTKTVDIGDVPRLMASAIYPPTASGARVVIGLKKQMRDDDGALVPGLHPLTSDPLRDYEIPEEKLLEAIFLAESGETTPPLTDWAMLNQAWAALPDFLLPLPEDEWVQYADAIAEHNTGWLLVPEWESQSEATVSRLRLQSAQRVELAKALETGEIVLRSATTLQPDDAASNQRRSARFVLVEELKAYAARFEIAVVVARAVSNAPPPITPVKARTRRPEPNPFDTEVKGPVDWKHWRTVTTELWQALLLSLNVEPPGNGWLLDNGTSGSDRTGDIPYEYLDAHGLADEFTRRSRVLRNRLQRIHAIAGRLSQVELTEFIELPLFAAWATEFEWEGLPAELVDIGQKQAAMPQGGTPTDEAEQQSREQWESWVRDNDEARQNPDYKAKYERAWALYEDLEKWERMKHNDDPLRAIEIEKRLASIRAELNELNQVPGLQTDEPGAPESLRFVGISKAQAIDAFDALVTINLASALEDGPKWIADARLSKGTPGGRHRTLWCPVLLAICLYEKHRVKKSALNRVFFDHDFLKGWRDAWHEQSADLP